MSMRAIVTGLASLGIPLALLVLVLPTTWGYGGYYETGAAGQHYATISFVDPAGPAYRAGVRLGDRVDTPRGMQLIREDGGPIGTIAVLHIVEDTRIRDISFAFVPYSGRLAVQQQIGKIVDGLAALAVFALAIIVVLRARDPRIGVRAATVLVVAGATALALGGALVCNNAVAGYVLYFVLPSLLGSATLWAAVALLAVLPPPVSRLRRVLPAVSLGALAYALYVTVALRLVPLLPDAPALPLVVAQTAGTILVIVLRLPLAIACVDAIITSDEEHAAATRWLCSLWLVSWVCLILPFAVRATGSTILFSHYGDILGAASVTFLALGIAYPILRHRLVDLNILISRATVFALVSVIIVALFVTIEWAASKVLEQALGVTMERAEIPSQVLTLALVIILGLSARWIHRFVEQTLTRAFFRKRLRGLANIEACAQEIDVATALRPVVDVAVATVMRSLDVRGCSIYMLDGSAFVCAASSGDVHGPERYDFNDIPPLKLRRWRRHVQLPEDASDTLFLPMLVRGDLLGFLACGGKIDRTAFLDDEISALNLLAHHVGLAQATIAPTPTGKLQQISIQRA